MARGLPPLNVRNMVGYVLHYMQHDRMTQAAAIAKAMQRFGVPSTQKGGITSGILRILRAGSAVTDIISAPGFTGTLRDALQGANPPSELVGVRIDYRNTVTGETRQIYVEAHWGMSLTEVVQQGYNSLIGYYPGEPGWSPLSYSVRGPTWLPAPNQT